MSPGAPRIVLPADVLAVLAAQARRALPAECCGALLGQDDGGLRTIRAALPLANAAAAPGRYEIGPADVRQAEAVARERQLAVVGFYHSHPHGSAEPSPADLEAAWPWYVYMIVDPLAGVARAWRLRDDRSAFEPLAVEHAW